MSCSMPALIGDGKARQAVVYHNTTPKQFLPELYWPDCRSGALHQRHHLRYVDEVWNVSVVNAEVARALPLPRIASAYPVSC